MTVELEDVARAATVDALGTRARVGPVDPIAVTETSIGLLVTVAHPPRQRRVRRGHAARWAPAAG